MRPLSLGHLVLRQSPQLAIRAAGGNGPYVMFALAENDMLAAEGYLRTGQPASAIPLINKYRTRAALQAIPLTAIITDQSRPLLRRHAIACRAYRKPPTYTSTACGTVFEAMKWESALRPT